MRTFSLVVAACFAICSSASAQHYSPYSAPSRLSYPSPAYGAVYQAPKPPMPMGEKPEALPLTQDPQPVPHGGSVHGDVVHEGCGCNSGHAACDMGCTTGGACCGMGGGWSMPCIGPGYRGRGCSVGAGGIAGRGCCWFGSLSGLIMTRDDNNAVWTSFDANVVNSTLLGTPDAEPDDWRGGFEVTVGRNLGCGIRVAGTYWTLDPDHASRTIRDANAQISSSLTFNNLNFTAADPVNNWYANAQAQRVRMRSEIHNAECNVLGDIPTVWYPRHSLGISWLAGFRFFRFDENMDFCTSDNATEFGVDPTGEACYHVDVENNLFGFQIGARVDWQCLCQLGVYAESRVGVYYNHIEHRTLLQSGIGQIAFDQFGNRWDIQTEKEAFSALAQVDVGLNYQINCCWSAHLGYRLVAASGMALSTNQVPFFIADFDGIQSIDRNGHLFLHGATVGLTACF